MISIEPNTTREEISKICYLNKINAKNFKDKVNCDALTFIYACQYGFGQWYKENLKISPEQKAINIAYNKADSDTKDLVDTMDTYYDMFNSKDVNKNLIVLHGKVFNKVCKEGMLVKKAPYSNVYLFNPFTHTNINIDMYDNTIDSGELIGNIYRFAFWPTYEELCKAILNILEYEVVDMKIDDYKNKSVYVK